MVDVAKDISSYYPYTCPGLEEGTCGSVPLDQFNPEPPKHEAVVLMTLQNLVY
jgi:hypothetical protein